MNPLIAPSILAADFANIQKEVEMLNSSEADYIHVDIMDGIFVPNISFGIPVTEAIYKHAKKPLDVHLMIQNPDQYLEAFRKAGAAVISVHYEACSHLHRTLQAIKQLGAKAGVAINPHTPVELLVDVLEDIDVVIIMSVNPGFGGQKFIENTYSKVKRLKSLIQENGADTQIEIDGGVNLENAPKLLSAGADILVAGSFVFSSPDPILTIAELKSITMV
ncbi:ribulose-phosphate 3-epimerase [Algoriphagus zhangzhouensis]|uniref:Ribulose-phosphate 3-epimerase n=1 Tax=Algoriphagus zhangzhouensis TaxID=1073327 RepID=A0A1M7Z672_9BACT|nr:ribulose-phosphate 3-epimerase [Algoriphagus zhangzhouensis]TDY49074.1 ribulose-phosphate 3-epimerase [Algoriphagus zhangzhouensis]SHO60391.1 ribulose-phosphate 3-epimerase [Algoriphagus zhangzhouensis]